jgi:hypothetical protein
VRPEQNLYIQFFGWQECYFLPGSDTDVVVVLIFQVLLVFIYQVPDMFIHLYIFYTLAAVYVQDHFLGKRGFIPGFVQERTFTGELIREDYCIVGIPERGFVEVYFQERLQQVLQLSRIGGIDGNTIPLIIKRDRFI